MPYTNGVGITYDNGEYEKRHGRGAGAGRLAGLCRRARRQSRARGKLRGIGIANYIEGAGGFPRERAEVTVAPEGRVELVLGTMNSGQGHETSFAQLLTEWLGVPFDSVDFVAHDTDRVTAGGGSHSGRSMRIASLAIGNASDEIIEKGKRDRRASARGRARSISSSPRGVFAIKGTDRRIGIFDVAKAAATRKRSAGGSARQARRHRRRDRVGRRLSLRHACLRGRDRSRYRRRCSSLRWTGVDDVGLAVNPLILHGQTHGAAAQGIGQALLEQCYYDRGERPDADGVVHGLRRAARAISCRPSIAS